MLAPWLPALLIAALSAGALLAAVPQRAKALIGLRLGVIAILGASALAVEVWQAVAVRQEIGHLERSDQTQAGQIAALNKELANLKERTHGRALGAETAARLSAYLQSFGGRAVVVSCIPNDVEAYDYATEIADALRSAKWDARGPETTTIFGNIPAVGINVVDNGAPGSDTAKILTDAFTKVGIPYQTRVPPSETLQRGMVELFISAKAEKPATATKGNAH
jgi:hypothetical protein